MKRIIASTWGRESMVINPLITAYVNFYMFIEEDIF